MKGWIGLFVMVVGLVLAASFGARNGEQHTRYRHLDAEVGMAEDRVGALQAELAVAVETRQAQVDAFQAARERGEDAELPGQAYADKQRMDDVRAMIPRADGELAVARSRRDQVGLPLPGRRWVQWASVGGLGWLAGIVLILVGASLARLQNREEQSGTGSSAAARIDYLSTMAEVDAEIVRIQGAIADLGMDQPADAARAALDHLDQTLLDGIVQGRGQLVALHGLGGFATYFGTFSAGERNLHRAWSALTDGHAVVARESLVASRAHFASSVEQYQAVDSGR